MSKLDKKWLLPSLILVYSMNFMDRSVLSIVGEAMKADMGLTDAQLGLIHSALLVTLIFILLPFAMVNDVWKRRKFIGLCSGIWGLAMAGTAAAGSFFSLLVARAFGSVNEGATASGGTAWLSQAYPAEQRGKILGFFMMSAPLGMTLGTLLGGGVLALTGSWRLSFYLFVIPALVMAFVVPRLPDNQPASSSGFLKAMPMLLKSKTLVFTGVACGFYIILKFAYQAWIPILMIRVYDLDPKYAAPIAAAFLLVGVLGPYLGGMLSDIWARKSPKGRVLSAAFIMALIVLTKIVFYYQLGKASLPVIFAIGLIDGMVMMMPIPVYFSIVQDTVDDQYRGSATGLFGMISFISGGAWGPALVGFLSDAFGGGADGLLYAMSTLLVFIVLAAAIYLYECKHYLREKKVNLTA